MFYLETLQIENIGPFEKLLLKFPFTTVGNPVPTALVGKNGSGKTIVLSSIADALMEFCQKSFIDTLPEVGTGYTYFKSSGGLNQKAGKKYGMCFLNFTKEGEKQIQFLEKTGEITQKDCKAKTNGLLNIQFGGLNMWHELKNQKFCSTNLDEIFEKSFQKNSFCFFPQYRFEKPHWLNITTKIEEEQFDIQDRFSNNLRKPIYIISSLEQNIQWLLALNLDWKWQSRHNPWTSFLYEKTITLLRLILEEDEIDFLLKSRFDAQKIGVGRLIESGKRYEWIVPSLRNLSCGQSALFNMLLTIIRYSDSYEKNSFDDIKGIVLIDEVDLYLHFKLKNEILPKLISEFPKVQFIFSTHSPLVLTGMKKHLNVEFSILEMPSGNEISIKQYEEFEGAYSLYLEENIKYKNIYEKLSSYMESIEKPLIITEGKTDWMHLKTALAKLKSQGRYENFDIEFHEYGEELTMGGKALLALCKGLSKLKNQKKVICIFDRDDQGIVKSHPTNSDFWNHGNEVYSFCIPIPKSREAYENISIEFYYSDKELKTPDPDSGKRLFFSNEVNRQIVASVTTEKFINEKFVILNEPKENEELEKKVYDKDCSKIENEDGEKVAISKSAFAKLVQDKSKGFENFNFDNFSLIFDVIAEILNEKKQAQ